MEGIGIGYLLGIGLDLGGRRGARQSIQLGSSIFAIKKH